MKIYINGDVDSTDTYLTAIETIIDPLTIARSPDNLNGTMDEVRLSNVGRSPNWIKTEYANQYNPSSFYTVASPENSPVIYYWPFPAFRYRTNITINSAKVFADLTNFTVLINLNDTNLHNQDKVQADGDDIMFAIDSTKLEHEIERFDQTGNGTHAHLVAWVRMPNLSGLTNTTISMYYGNSALQSQQNPSGVWGSNYMGVWHLSETSGAAGDSTSWSNDGTLRGTPTRGIVGSIGFAYDFDGIDDYVSLANPNTQSTGTYSFWIYPHTVTGNEFNILASSDNYKRIHLYLSKIRVETDTNDEYFFFDSTILSANTWQHVVFTRTGDIGDLYVDGSWVQQVGSHFEYSEYRKLD
jgi:hypothetical protein